MSDEFTISSTISLLIPSFSEKYIEKKTVTFYNIDVVNNYSRQKWQLEKRYSEFEVLHASLLKLFTNVPKIPSKSLFKVSSYEALTKRRLQLEQFLQECVQRKDIVSNENFKDFLELDKHSPELSYNTPVKISEYVDLPLGVRDFVYLKYEGVLFLVCSDMNIASRIDSYVTNVNLPWEKKTDAHISVGAVFAYKVSSDPKNAYQFDKVWAKSYPIQTGVVVWDADSFTVAVGLDNGKIVFYKVNPESNFLQYEELCEVKPHKDRVMGIAFDHKTGYIYSCSSDKKFIVSEINYQESVTEVTLGSHGFTNLVFEKKNERIFLTNEVGVVFVYSTANFPPTLVNSVQTSSKSAIRGLHIDFKKFYIFTSSIEGKICLLDLGLPGKERFIKEITTFGGTAQVNKYNFIPLVEGSEVYFLNESNHHRG